MSRSSHLQITRVVLVSTLLTGIIGGGVRLQALGATIDVGNQERDTSKETNGLKTKVPHADDRKPPAYILQVQQSQSLQPIGIEPVRPVEMLPPDASAQLGTSADDAWVPINRPPLQAFISVQNNLNPFSLDAGFTERIALEDALNGAMSQNLAIANSFDGMKVQKFTYLSTLSKFLPDLKAGYNLVALNGSIPSALLGSSSGASGSSSSGSFKLPSAAQVLTAGFTYNAYQGGKVLFGSLEQRHRLRAARAELKVSVNDVLLDVAKRYYDLVLNEALLEIRNRAVEISTEQVRLNSSQEKAGTATGLDVLQSQSQLASDQQNLVAQQSTRRQSAIQLTTTINSSYAQDLTSAEGSLKKRRVIPRRIPIAQLLLIAVDNRPELKQYEELRLAAKRAIVVAGAPLQPKVALGGSVYGIGANGTGTAGSSSSGTTLSSLSSIFVLNFSVNWALGSLGTTDLANIQQARWQARQATVQAKQSFQSVFEQVRTAYDQSLAADSRIEKASAQIAAAEEELRIAKKRMEAGIGLNLDVLNAQRDLTQAGINKAQAIVDFNVAQAQLLHDVGLISTNTLIAGARI